MQILSPDYREMLALLFFFQSCLAINMNQKGLPYSISNPNGIYSTDMETNINGKVEHFDVYGEVRTKFTQVYWTYNNLVNLPPELV